MNDLTAENAPRDVKALADAGRYQMKSLAKKLKLIETEEQIGSWSSLTSEKQAQELVSALKAFDNEGGGGETSSAAATKPKRTPSNKTAEAPPSTGGGSAGSDSKMDTVLEVLAGLKEDIDRVERLVVLQSTLSLMMGEQMFSAKREDIAEEAISEMKNTVALLGKAVAGSKKK